MELNKINENFFNKDAEEVAKALLGRVLVRKFSDKGNERVLKAKIVETEAYYDEKDPASRARQNGDLRKTMLNEPGTILVYGVHNNWLINFVTNSKGKAQAVLLRALEPLNFQENTRGPGLLTKAMFIDKKFHNQNILNSKELWIESGLNYKDGLEIIEKFRIGIKKDLPKKLRFYIKNNEYVSKK